MMEDSKLELGAVNAKKSRRPFRRSPMFWVRTVVIILAILLLAVALTGRLAVTFKQPDQRVTVRSNVCSDTVITKYNAATANISPADPTPSSVNDLIADFSKNANYQDDPTCLYIKFNVLMQKNDYAEANKIYEKMSKLAEDGVFTSTKLYNMSGLDSMKRNLDFIKPVNAANPTRDLTEVGND